VSSLESQAEFESDGRIAKAELVGAGQDCDAVAGIFAGEAIEIPDVGFGGHNRKERGGATGGGNGDTKKHP
jgi:hypothetical protein